MKYYYNKYIPSAFFVFILLIPLNLFANSYVNFTINKLEKNVLKITFPTQMAIGKIAIPSINKNLWGDRVCTFLVISSNNEKRICTVSETGKLITDFNDHTSKSLILSPIILKKIKTTKFHSNSIDAIEIQAKPLKIKQIEMKLSNFADSLILFHNKNKCFSCHTLYPFATTCRTASDRGISVPTSKLKTIGSQLSAMQNKDGYFTFPQAPTYGIISPTLCAGYILAELTRYQPSLYINLKNIVAITDKLCDPHGSYLYDFSFPPFFIGQITSEFFASKLLADYYYLSLSFYKQPLEIAQKSLKLIKDKYSTLEKLSGRQKLIVMFGFPNMCDVTSENYIRAIKSLSPVMMQKGMFSKIQFQTIFQVISEKLYTPPIYTHKSVNKNLAEQIWETLGKIITIKVQDN